MHQVGVETGLSKEYFEGHSRTSRFVYEWVGWAYRSKVADILPGRIVRELDLGRDHPHKSIEVRHGGVKTCPWTFRESDSGLVSSS